MRVLLLLLLLLLLLCFVPALLYHHVQVQVRGNGCFFSLVAVRMQFEHRSFLGALRIPTSYGSVQLRS
jgi:competence protein ComGC